MMREGARDGAGAPSPLTAVLLYGKSFESSTI